MRAPASPPFLSMACIYGLSGLGVGEEEESKQVKHRGQYRAASVLGFLVAAVVAAGRAGPFAAIWFPFSRATWGLPSAFEMSGQRALLLPVLRLLKAESEGKDQEMGWFAGSEVWPGSNQDGDRFGGRENALGARHLV